MRVCLLTLALISGLFTGLQARLLSPQAKISLLTIAPGEELYSAFGHTAIWVDDPITGINTVYNYGTFDFQPPLWKFYLNFASGRLNYRLDTESYAHFERVYHYFERSYSAQVLQLTAAQKQRVYDFLEYNYLPENREYLYEFFYDNCATRVRDLFQEVLGDTLQYADYGVETDKTFRDYLWVYLKDRRWVGFGIDLLLGAAVDRPATHAEAMFLPDFLAEEFDRARLQTASQMEKTFVRRTVQVYRGKAAVVAEPWPLRPLVICWVILGIVATFTARKWSDMQYRSGWDASLFIIAGIAGLILFLLWFATIHTATVQNYNLLWLLPTHLVAGFALLRKRRPSWLRGYFFFAAATTALPILGWFFLPQHFNPAFLPVMLLLLLRIGVFLRKSQF